MRKRVITLCLVLLWMAVIFSFSAQTADESGSLSWGLTEKLVHLQNEVLNLGWTKQKIMEISILLEKPLRKLAHASEYAVLGVLVALHVESLRADAALRSRGRVRKWLESVGLRILLSEAVCVLYAASDEFHQLFVEDRSGQFTDVCIDGAGALAGILVCAGILAWVGRRRAKRLAGDIE